MTTDDECICGEINARNCPQHQADERKAPREWIIEGSGGEPYQYISPGIFKAKGSAFYEGPLLKRREQVRVISYDAYESLLARVQPAHEECEFFRSEIRSINALFVKHSRSYQEDVKQLESIVATVGGERDRFKALLTEALPLLKTYDSGQWKEIAEKIEGELA